MNNCKIRVNNEAESREAQELFFALGYKKGVCTSGEYPATIVAVVESLHRDTPFYSRALSLNHDAHKDYIGLTLPQLRELVAQSKSKEQGLISGADALNDYSNAQVSYDFGNGEYKWFPLDQCEFSIPQILKGHNDAYDSFALAKLVFRLKPRTVKLEIEVPAPFEPSECEEFYVLSSVQPTGYIKTNLKSHALLGAWRTEAEIKIVVEQLRKLKEHSK